MKMKFQEKLKQEAQKMIISCGSTKGGAGKSFLSQNLATFFSLILKKKTLLVDADPQECTAKWAHKRLRNEKYTNIDVHILYGEIRDDLLKLEKSYDIIVVDSGGQDSNTTRDILSVSSIVLVPCRPQRRDLGQLPDIEKVVNIILRENPACIFKSVISQAPTNYNQRKKINQAKAVCKSYGLPAFNTVLYYRSINDDSEENGGSLSDLGNNVRTRQAKKELENLVNEIMKLEE